MRADSKHATIRLKIMDKMAVAGRWGVEVGRRAVGVWGVREVLAAGVRVGGLIVIVVGTVIDIVVCSCRVRVLVLGFVVM